MDTVIVYSTPTCMAYEHCHISLFFNVFSVRTCHGRRRILLFINVYGQSTLSYVTLPNVYSVWTLPYFAHHQYAWHFEIVIFYSSPMCMAHENCHSILLSSICMAYGCCHILLFTMVYRKRHIFFFANVYGIMNIAW